MKFILWLATIVEDKAGVISSKRIGFFWCLWMLNKMVGKPNVDELIVYTVAFLAFGLAGLTLPEWFSNIKNTKTTETTETTIKNQ